MAADEKTVGRMIAEGILEDVLDRRGIKHEFVACDDEVIEDILNSWEKIANEYITK